MVDVGDFNRDGWVDIVAGDRNLNSVVKYMNKLNEEPVALAFPHTVVDGTLVDTRDVVAVDIDGDLDIDIVVASRESNAVRVFQTLCCA